MNNKPQQPGKVFVADACDSRHHGLTGYYKGIQISYCIKCEKVWQASPLPTSSSIDKDAAIKFYNWLHEEGYSFSDKRYYVYLGGKNIYVK